MVGRIGHQSRAGAAGRSNGSGRRVRLLWRYCPVSGYVRLWHARCQRCGRGLLVIVNTVEVRPSVIPVGLVVHGDHVAAATGKGQLPTLLEHMNRNLLCRIFPGDRPVMLHVLDHGRQSGPVVALFDRASSTDEITEMGPRMRQADRGGDVKGCGRLHCHWKLQQLKSVED